MLTVKTPEEASAILAASFPERPLPCQTVALEEALGRVLAAPVVSAEYVPGFDRSTVDGYAVRAADTFGCSDAVPAILTIEGEILMGQEPPGTLSPGSCMIVPTGGALPKGADAVVMLEYSEDYGDGTIGVCKSAAPGLNLIFKGDDAFPGKVILPAGKLLTAQDIGALAAMGVVSVPVSGRPLVAILSTGDELVPAGQSPAGGQVRDVNSSLLAALVRESGGEARSCGIFRDDEASLHAAVREAVSACDAVLISGGSSVGSKDAVCSVIQSQGELLLHGIAMKPGKPTILGKVNGKPVFGLPGHPVAAFFVAQLFVRPLLARWMGRELHPRQVPAVLTEPVNANHGRAQYGGVVLTERAGVLYAAPIRSKSGLITSLAGSDGWFCVPRDCEGIAAGETVAVTLYTVD